MSSWTNDAFSDDEFLLITRAKFPKCASHDLKVYRQVTWTANRAAVLKGGTDLAVYCRDCFRSYHPDQLVTVFRAPNACQTCGGGTREVALFTSTYRRCFRCEP